MIVEEMIYWLVRLQAVNLNFEQKNHDKYFYNISSKTVLF